MFHRQLLIESDDIAAIQSCIYTRCVYFC